MPFFSVIVPVYNAEKYIERCLCSISNQSFQDIEILVINDGSSDRSLDAAKEYAKSDSRIKIFSQDNQGGSAARTLGIEKASGEYICFVDADDYIESTMIEKLLQASDTKILGVCNYVHNDSPIKILRNMPRNSYLKTGADLYKDFLVGELGKQIGFSSWNKMFSLKVIRKHGIRFPKDVAIGEDMIFVLRYLCYIEQIRCIDEGLYHYHIYDTSAMNAAVRNYLPEYCRTLQALRQMDPDKQILKDDTVARWAIEVFAIIFTNAYVTRMPYADFVEYYREVSDSDLFAMALLDNRKDNIKRMVLGAILRTHSRLALYLLIKFNHWRLRKNRRRNKTQ